MSYESFENVAPGTWLQLPRYPDQSAHTSVNKNGWSWTSLAAAYRILPQK